MQKTWLLPPSPGKSAATLALSLCLLTGCFEEENKTQSKNQESTTAQVVETIAGIDVPTAPENPLGQSDWTADFLEPGKVVETPEITLPTETAEEAPAPIEAVKAVTWYLPVKSEKAVMTSGYMVVNWTDYPKTGHHPGVDYDVPGDEDVQLQFCGNGDVVDRGEFSNIQRYPLAKWLGNYFFLYVPSIDRTFLYAHLREAPPALGQVNAGDPCGIAGKTGTANGIHLHFECWKGRRTANTRDVSSRDSLIRLTEDPACVLTHYLSGKTNEPSCSWQEPEAPQPLGTSRTVGTSSLLDALHHENP